MLRLNRAVLLTMAALFVILLFRLSHSAQDNTKFITNDFKKPSTNVAGSGAKLPGAGAGAGAGVGAGAGAKLADAGAKLVDTGADIADTGALVAGGAVPNANTNIKVSNDAKVAADPVQANPVKADSAQADLTDSEAQTLNTVEKARVEANKKDSLSTEKKPVKVGSIINDLPRADTPYDRANATFVTLARNSDLYSLIPSIQDVEDRFNKKYHYDWVFLNDEEFSDEFKKVTTELISGTTKYAVIPPSMWGYPDFIDQTKADEARKAMGAKGIIYGDNLSYRHMCRFESGFFWRHPVMLDYRWYWRVEPDTKLFCDVNYDLFKYMEDNNKSYGFTISMYEYKATIETLWETTKNFTKENPQFVAKDNLMKFLSSNNGEDYNLCHFWSNFEVADMDFWRGEAYTKYFDYLDRSGGFFYERWGDAPVHSIAASLFLPRDKVHHFEDVGYYHPPYTHCPTDVKIRLDRKCSCNPQDNFAWQGYSCTKNYYDSQGYEKPAGWENQS